VYGGRSYHRREMQDRTNGENLVAPQDCGNDIPGAIYVGYIPQVADEFDVSRTATVAPTEQFSDAVRKRNFQNQTL
jgi:hypothetical protein